MKTCGGRTQAGCRSQEALQAKLTLCHDVKEFVPAAAQRTASSLRRSIREERVGKAEKASLIYMEATCVAFYHFLLYLDPIYCDATCDIQAQSWLYEPLHTRPPCDNKAPRLVAVKQYVPSVASRGGRQEKEKNMSHDHPYPSEVIFEDNLTENEENALKCFRKTSQKILPQGLFNLVSVPTNLPLSDIR